MTLGPLQPSPKRDSNTRPLCLESKCLTHSANLPDDVLDEESERSVGRGNRGSFGPTGTPFLLSVPDCEEPKPSVVFRLHVLSCNSRLALEVKRLLQN